jgi:hypothetical protein
MGTIPGKSRPEPAGQTMYAYDSRNHGLTSAANGGVVRGVAQPITARYIVVRRLALIGVGDRLDDFDFGGVTVGHTLSKTFKLTNSGGQASSALKINLTGSAAISTRDTCTATSPGPRQSCAVAVPFAPAGPGSDTSTLTAVSKHAATAGLSMSGVGSVPGHIYWASDVPVAINEANLDGANPKIRLSAQADPTGVAVDADHIYLGCL